MEARQPCKLLEWDTAFFGMRMAAWTGGELRAERVKAAVEWCKANHVDCLYALSDANDTAGARVLERAGARNIDVRMTFALDLARRMRHETSRAVGAVPGTSLAPSTSPAPSSVDNAPSSSRAPTSSIRPARATDIPPLRALAAQSHTNSRFWTDEAFSRERCAELYATWIEKSVRGWADVVFVPEMDGHPVGYLSCHVRDAQRGEIGLVAIDPAAQGKGLGGEMLDAALDWFQERGLARVVVVTQGRNAGAQRLYQSRGFQTEAVQVWHHLWFPRETSPR